MYMDVKIKLNGKLIIDSVDQDMVLLDFCRKHNCFSVKRGCESGNCGLCTVLLDGKPVLSCSMPIGRADGRAVEIYSIWFFYRIFFFIFSGSVRLL